MAKNQNRSLRRGFQQRRLTARALWRKHLHTFTNEEWMANKREFMLASVLCIRTKTTLPIC